MKNEHSLPWSLLHHLEVYESIITLYLPDWSLNSWDQTLSERTVMGPLSCCCHGSGRLEGHLILWSAQKTNCILTQRPGVLSSPDKASACRPAGLPVSTR